MPGAIIPGFGCFDWTDEYKPGDPEPEDAGYNDWHEWARVQHKAGLRQQVCVMCCLWKYPQDLADRIVTSRPMTSDGKRVTLKHRICKKCDAKAPAR